MVFTWTPEDSSQDSVLSTYLVGHSILPLGDPTWESRAVSVEGRLRWSGLTLYFQCWGRKERSISNVETASVM